MSARERNRYLTTAVVFLLAFSLIGLLLVRSAWVMAQQYTFRPSVGVSNVYDTGKQSTISVGFAFDQNLNTAATSLTNSPFLMFTWSGKWSGIQQSTTFIRAVALYVLRDGTDNVANQWRIQYTLSGPSAGDASWFTIDSDAISGPNPTKGNVTTALPNDTDFSDILAVRTTSQQQGTVDAKLNIYDVRVEAEWNPISGGLEPLHITTTSLPPGSKYASYNQLVQATGGNKPYTWEIVSGVLPPQFSGTNTNAPNYDYNVTYSGSTPYTTPGTYNFILKVTDTSSPVQTDQKEFSIQVAGLAIIPTGPNLPAATKNGYYTLTFTSAGGTSPFFWCLVSGSLPAGLSFGSLPDCPSTVQGNSITLSGIPTNSGVYSFTLRLADSGEETPVQNYYILEVSTGGLRILRPSVKPMIKGMYYSNATYSVHDLDSVKYPLEDYYQRMEAQALTATNVVYSTPHTPQNLPSWTSSGLSTLGFELANETLNKAAKTSNVYIVGLIPVTTPGGNYSFSATVTDKELVSPYRADTDTTHPSVPLRVLERRTLLTKTPPSTVSESAGVAINLSSVTNEDNLKVGDVLTTMAGTTFVASGVVAWYDPDSPGFLVVDHPDVTKWVANNTVEGPSGASPFSASISSTPAPPKAIVAPAHPTFTVFGEGGAPSYQTGAAPDGKQVPYYNYTWQVLPVPNTNSPALDSASASGTTPTNKSGPEDIAISFVDTSQVPVTGTYDVTIRAQDVLRRANPTDTTYEFVPLTVRVNVVMPAGLEQRVGRPTKLRQEQFK